MGKSSELKEELVGLIRAFKEGVCTFAKGLGCAGEAGPALPPVGMRPDDGARLEQAERERKTLAAHVEELKRKLQAAQEEQQATEAKLRSTAQALEHERQRLRAKDEEITDLKARCIRPKELDERLEVILEGLATHPDLARRIRIKLDAPPAMQILQLAQASTDKKLIGAALEGLDSLPKETMRSLGGMLLPLMVDWHNQFVTNPSLHLSLQTDVPEREFNNENHRRLPAARGERILGVLLPGLSGPSVQVKPLVEVGD
jgi:outer membrane murein-binding lipoprotein Lpp